MFLVLRDLSSHLGNESFGHCPVVLTSKTVVVFILKGFYADAEVEAPRRLGCRLGSCADKGEQCNHRKVAKAAKYRRGVPSALMPIVLFVFPCVHCATGFELLSWAMSLSVIVQSCRC